MAEDTNKDPQTTELDTSKLKQPNDSSKSSGTPIGDEVQRELEQLDAEDEGEDVPGDGDIPFASRSFKDDVERALERETQDGKGDDEVPESDWQGYATEGVEVED